MSKTVGMENGTNEIQLTIAGFPIWLYSDSFIELEDGYLPFVSSNAKKEDGLIVNCLSGLPKIEFQKEKLVFEADNKDQKFYAIYQTDKGLCFVIYNQQTQTQIQQIAFLDKSHSHWEIYSEPNSENKLIPLRYPMGPIIMHYMTLQSDAVMMHASCAFDGTSAKLFTGFSGTGKSTMSKLWAEAGNQIINDDRIIIRKQGNEYFAHNTPMYYRDIPKKAPLSSIFLISHAPENKIKKLTGAAAISNVMAFSIQNNFDKQFIESRLALFADLCSNVSVFKLGFVPTPDIIRFIKKHEAEKTE